MQRRTFLQLLGGTFVTLAVEPVIPAWTRHDTTIYHPWILVDDIFLSAEEWGSGGWWSVGRPGGERPILRVGVAQAGILRWVATPGQEIIVKEGDSLEIQSPGDLGDWYLAWLHQGKRYLSGKGRPLTCCDL